jgi:hypothetical protein
LTPANVRHPHIGISARRGPALAAQRVRDQRTEELRTAEQLAQLQTPLLAEASRTVGARAADRSGGYGGS